MGITNNKNCVNEDGRLATSCFSLTIVRCVMQLEIVIGVQVSQYTGAQACRAGGRSFLDEFFLYLMEWHAYEVF